MSAVRYRITDLHASIFPGDNEPEQVRVGVSIDMGDPTLNDSENLSTDCSIDFKLFDPETEWDQDIDEMDAEYGDVEIQFQIDADVSPSAFDESIDVREEVASWNSEGYENVDSTLISHIESGFLSELFAPLEQLLDDSVIGILPRYRFTRTVEEQERFEQHREETEEESSEES